MALPRRKRRSIMSKIICDVCGTTYPETGTQCPICGCAKSADSRTVTGDKVAADSAAASSYQFVKGGRFSKKNVIKRNKQNLARQEMRNAPQDEMDEEEEGSNKGLIVLLLILLAAIIAVVIYIAIRFFGPGVDDPGKVPGGTTDPNPSASTSATTEPTAEPTTEPTTEPTEVPTTEPTEEPTYPCVGLSLKDAQIQLDEPGSTAKITVSASPVNTTDVITFASDNEAVATVDSNGNVTAVGEGTAKITVTCGSFEVRCTVEVVYPTSEPTTEPSTEPSTEPTEPKAELKLNRSDFSLFGKGETWDLYSGSAPKNKVTWSSSNENVATVKNGVVTAVGPGTATIYAEYEGEKLSCIVRCNWTEETTAPTLDPNETYTISHSDVSISVGESFRLTLTDSSGNVVNANWQASRSGYVSISGNTVTGVASINSNSFTVYTTIGGTTYSCIVRIK